jgi:CheY-like chemotaxis protein
MEADDQARSHSCHTVLVVEDDADTRESLALLLECEGFGVTSVANGLEAIHLMQTLGFRPCAVVVDLIMPVMDGLTLGRHMLADPELARIPLFGLTGHEGLRRHALTEGFTAAYLKPADLDAIIALIGSHCPSGSAEATKKRRA